METFNSIKVWKHFRASLNTQCTIGLIPTMGAIHKGHLSLIEKSITQNDYTVVSIFVNPEQFAPDEDFDSYPRALTKDQSVLETLGVDVLFLPDDKMIYPDNFSTYVEESSLSKGLEAP